jgi:hypothetical protein
METMSSSTIPSIDKKIFGDPQKDTSPHALRELLEKNLKWSHLIFEQNRRILRVVVLILLAVGLAMGLSILVLIKFSFFSAFFK